MATIRKHRDKYQVQVRRKGCAPVSRSFLRLSDAKEWARHVELKADRQELGPDRKVLETITLADLINRYLIEYVPLKKGAEIEMIILHALLRHPICKKHLSNLSTADFAAYRDERLKTISPKSLKRQLSPVHNMFEVAVLDWDIPLSTNPLTSLTLKANDNKRQRRLRNGELDKIEKAAKATRNPLVLPIIYFALETAMRRGEMLALRWNDIDFERLSVTVHESKNGYSRIIPISPKAAAILVELGGDKPPVHDALIFPMAANALRLSWERLVRRARIEDLHFHDLRHEAISRLFEFGLTTPEVASISGHRDMRMLFRYAHANHAIIRAKLSAAAG